MITPNAQRGDRVKTPHGPGTLAYIRLDHLAPAGAPMGVAAASVVLDRRLGDHNYTGTIFAGADVEPL